MILEPPIEPMLAKSVPELPPGEGWLFEPKWDGFRAIAFRDGDRLYLQSRDLRPLDRYFPDLAAPLRATLPARSVVDGEIVIATDEGLDFDALQMRLHPAASRVAKLAAETPASFVAFDLLAEGDEDLRSRPQAERRARLEEALARAAGRVHLTPCTRDRAVAQEWFHRFEGAGLDGVIAKHESTTYQPGKRVMLKIKHTRTADCVVAGFRWHKTGPGELVGSLLLGLYDDEGALHHVGVTSSFTTVMRRQLAKELEPLRTPRARGASLARVGRGARGLAPDAGRPEPLEPGEGSLVGAAPRSSASARSPTITCRATGSGTRRRSVRWRPDKPPAECRYDQLEVTPPAELAGIFGRAGG